MSEKISTQGSTTGISSTGTLLQEEANQLNTLLLNSSNNLIITSKQKNFISKLFNGFNELNSITFNPNFKIINHLSRTSLPDTNYPGSELELKEDQPNQTISLIPEYCLPQSEEIMMFPDISVQHMLHQSGELFNLISKYNLTDNSSVIFQKIQQKNNNVNDELILKFFFKIVFKNIFISSQMYFSQELLKNLAQSNYSTNLTKYARLNIRYLLEIYLLMINYLEDPDNNLNEETILQNITQFALLGAISGVQEMDILFVPGYYYQTNNINKKSNEININNYSGKYGKIITHIVNNFKKLNLHLTQRNISGSVGNSYRNDNKIIKLHLSK